MKIEDIEYAFNNWANEEPFPLLMIGWDHYDSSIKVIFINILGSYTQQDRNEIQEFVTKLKKGLVVGIISHEGDTECGY